MDLRSLVFSLDFKDVDSSAIKDMDKNMDNMKKSMTGVGAEANKMGKDLSKSMSGVAKETSVASRAFDKLKQSAAGQMVAKGIDTIKIAVDGVMKKIPALNNAFERIKNSHIGEKIISSFSKVKSVVGEVASTVTGKLGGAFDKIKNSAVGEKIGAGFNKLKGVMGSVVSVAGNMGNRLKSSMDKFKNSIMDAGKKLAELQPKMEKLGKSMMLKVTTPIVGFGAASIKTVAGFDDSMSAVQAISGATGKDFDNLRNKAKELGRTTAHSASDAAEGMTILASTGASTNDILSMTGDVLNLASSSGLGLEQSAGILTNTLGQFGLKATDANKVSNQLVKAANSSKTSVDGMGEAMKYAGTTAANMNMDVAQTAATLGIFANVGIEGSAAGTTFTAVANDLTKSAENGAIAIGDSSVAIYDANGNMRDMRSVMTDVESATKGMTDEQRNSALQAVFGQQAMKGVNAILSEGSKKYGELEKAIKKSDNAAATAAFLREDNLAGAFRAVGSAIEGLMIDVGDVIKGPIQSLAQHIVKFAGVFGNLSEPMKKFIVIIAGIAAAIGPVIFIVAKVIGVFMGLGPAIGALGTAFSIITGPIGIIVALITATVAVLIHLWRTNEQFRSAVISVWESIKSAVSSAIDFIIGLWSTFGDSIMSTIGNAFELIKGVIIISMAVMLGAIIVGVESIKMVWSMFGESIITIIQAAWSLISGVIEGAMTMIQGIIQIGMAIIQGDWSMLWNGLGQVVSGAIAIVTSIISAGFSMIQAIISAAISVVTSIVTAGFNLINAVVTAAVNVMKTIVLAAWNAISAAAGAVTSVVKSAWSSVTAVFDTVKSKVSSMAEGVVSAWNRVKDAVSKPITGAVNFVKNGLGLDGSNKTGLNRVPFDGYVSELHRDEMVLTKKASDQFRAMGGTKNSMPIMDSNSTANNYSSSNNVSNNYDNLTESSKVMNNNITNNFAQSELKQSEPMPTLTPETTETTNSTNNQSSSFNPTINITVEGNVSKDESKEVGKDIASAVREEFEKLFKEMTIKMS